MSRIGNHPINIPKGLEVKVSPTNLVEVKGPRGTLLEQVPSSIHVNLEGDILRLTVHSQTKKDKSLHGLYRALIYNMVVGVSQGYKKELELVGVGYKAALSNNLLEINVGKSHLIYMVLPSEIKAAVEPGKRGSNPLITLESCDKQFLGQIAAKICKLRAEDPYKGKGIYPKGKQIRRKAGKKAAK